MCSAWVVTLDAQAPFRAPFTRPEGDLAPLPYLDPAENRKRGAINVELDVWVQTDSMRAAVDAGDRLLQSKVRDTHWTVAQLVAHHLVKGATCTRETCSGPAPCPVRTPIKAA